MCNFECFLFLSFAYFDHFIEPFASEELGGEWFVRVSESLNAGSKFGCDSDYSNVGFDLFDTHLE